MPVAVSTVKIHHGESGEMPSAWGVVVHSTPSSRSAICSSSQSDSADSTPMRRAGIDSSTSRRTVSCGPGAVAGAGEAAVGPGMGTR